MASRTILMAAFTFLAFVDASNCCTRAREAHSSYTAPGTVATYNREGSRGRSPTLRVDPPNTHVAGKHARSVPSSPLAISAEEFFRDVDINGDEVMDACDWLNSPFATRIHDYVNMLADLDLNDDDALSMDEFKPITIKTGKM